jgi:adenylate cyclase
MRLLAVSLAAAVLAGGLAFAAVRPTQHQNALYGTADWSQSGFEWRLLDWRFQHRGIRNVSNDIALLAFDDDTDRVLGERFPYNRSRFASTIDGLCGAGAKSIVFDIQFMEQTTLAADRALLQSARAATRRGCGVVFATAPDPARGYVDVPLPLSGVERNREFVEGAPLAYTGASVGIANVDEASDHTVRWVRPSVRIPVQGAERDMSALAIAALQSAGSSVKGHVPNRMMVNFRGGRGAYEQHTFESTQTDVGGSSRPGDLGWASHKIVLIGSTSEVLHDIHNTPYGKMPGIQVHANAIDDLRSGTWLREQNPARAGLIALAMAILIWALLVFIPLLLSVPAAIGVVGAFAWYAQWQFSRGTVVWMVPPLATACAVMGAVVLVLAVAALRDRRRVAGLFARYVSPDVVRELMEQEELELGGERKTISVLFSDIQGFTSMSEHVDPSELVDQLNEYFGDMVQAVDDQRGTLDKFIGDGMMALFGAPNDLPDHASRACAAALDMTERLEALNAKRCECGLGELVIRIGINTGEAIVGNVGSPLRRVEFTAIGDAVNLASRMESSSKELGAQILVSESTAQAANAFSFAPRGSIVVKGRTQATAVFELVGMQVGTPERGSGDDTSSGTRGEAA